MQHRMIEAGAEIWDWIQAGAVFYVCGEPKRMAVDVDDALTAIIRATVDVDRDRPTTTSVSLVADKRYVRESAVPISRSGSQYAVRVRFAGQVAVVTGGALGIGGGISLRLAAAGAHVVLADLDSRQRPRTTSAAIEAAWRAGRCTPLVGDITRRGDAVAA